MLRAIAPDGDAPEPAAWLIPEGGGTEWTTSPQSIEPVAILGPSPLKGRRHVVQWSGAYRPRPKVLFDCKLCPGRGTDAEVGGVGERLVRWKVCRSCDFWLTCVGYRALGDQDSDGRRVLRVAGRHYMTWTEKQGCPPEIGYTSRSDLPYFLLEDEIVRNARWLWLMGSIPERFRERLPETTPASSSPDRQPRSRPPGSNTTSVSRLGTDTFVGAVSGYRIQDGDFQRTPDCCLDTQRPRPAGNQDGQILRPPAER
ncbi:hypothetical protein BU52_32930 [Streptomyces toyocaensis]|uniref:Uncharacterized protein n=1 Tax=Streptomyces toyocaensis TaxID=55952 RepID=A0A081XHH0_STRTO|nr:hypothetical protein [Streptomyces toyocaensis]KES02993.1 hypothetical protein BU52_32930 [Streptomyces toyocaensis]